MFSPSRRDVRVRGDAAPGVSIECYPVHGGRLLSGSGRAEARPFSI